MHLSYVQDINEESITLSHEESLHVTKVLRLSKGAPISVTNGQGWIGEGEILSNSKKNVQISILNSKTIECPYDFELAIAPTKSNDRLELILEKCTEIGIKAIHPIYTYHSERRKIKLDRMHKILISAMKQSQKSWLPILHEPVKFSDFLAQKINAQHKFIAHCNSSIKRESFKSCLTSESSLICIGPEGDFSTEEITSAVSAGFSSVHLGNERLRTETAAIFACGIHYSKFRL